MNSNERKLNIIFHEFLDKLSKSETVKLITECFNIPIKMTKNIDKMRFHSFYKIKNGREIDEYIDINKDIGIAVELKDKWKADPKRLTSYFQHVENNHNNAYLILISQSEDDIRHPILKNLFSDNRWVHLTWHKFYQWLETNLSFDEKSIHLRNFIQNQGLNVLKHRKIKEYGLNVDLPSKVNIMRKQLEVALFKTNKPLGCWQSREYFWKDIIVGIQEQIGVSEFFSFRRDIYHYMWRWAYYEKNIFFDMQDDNYWEYYIDYFENNMKGKIEHCEIIQMRKWYDYYLKIGKNKYIDIDDKMIGVISVNAKDCYFVCDKFDSNNELPRINLWEEIPW